MVVRCQASADVGGVGETTHFVTLGANAAPDDEFVGALAEIVLKRSPPG
jgi:hypothetical protein